MNAGPPRIATPDDPWRERELTKEEQAERRDWDRRWEAEQKRKKAIDDALGYRLKSEQEEWDSQHEEQWRRNEKDRCDRGREAQRAYRALCETERKAARIRKRNEQITRWSHWWMKVWDWLTRP